MKFNNGENQLHVVDWIVATNIIPVQLFDGL